MGCQEEEAEDQQGSEEAASVTCGQSERGEASPEPGPISQPGHPPIMPWGLEGLSAAALMQCSLYHPTDHSQGFPGRALS